MLQWVGRDLAPPDAKDLIPERTELSPDQNGYTYFVSATNTLFLPKSSSIISDYQLGRPVDDGMVQEIIVRNQNMLDMIRKGLDCKRCIAPEVIGYDASVPYINPWMKMGQIMALKARHERLAKNYVESTRSCILLLRFGTVIRNDAGCLINFLVGISLIDQGLLEVQALAGDSGTPQEELTRLSKALAAVGPVDPGLIGALKVECNSFAYTIDQISEGKFNMNNLTGTFGERTTKPLMSRHVPGFIFQPNKTKLAFADFIRDMIRQVPLCYADMKENGDAEKSSEVHNTTQLMIHPNAVGRILLALAIPALSSNLERKCRAQCNLSASRLLVACNAYLKAEGKLPESLQSLVPTYLAAIPADPYDGKPFRYSPMKGIIYSVGKDLKDSGGSSRIVGNASRFSASQKRWRAEDVVFEITNQTDPVPVGEIQKATPSAR